MGIGRPPVRFQIASRPLPDMPPLSPLRSNNASMLLAESSHTLKSTNTLSNMRKRARRASCSYLGLAALSAIVSGSVIVLHGRAARPAQPLVAVPAELPGPAVRSPGAKRLIPKKQDNLTCDCCHRPVNESHLPQATKPSDQQKGTVRYSNLDLRCCYLGSVLLDWICSYAAALLVPAAEGEAIGKRGSWSAAHSVRWP